MEQAQKDALKVVALNQRVAEIVAEYENKVADLRAEFTLIINEMNEQTTSLQAEIEELKGEDAEPSGGATEATDEG